MSECPEIVVYEITDETWLVGKMAPYVARFWQNGEFLPMIFSGETPGIVIGVARAFWKTETENIAASGVRLTKARGARHKAKKAAK
jgi:hypothetical protein